jgi:hypothetical protein
MERNTLATMVTISLTGARADGNESIPAAALNDEPGLPGGRRAGLTRRRRHHVEVFGVVAHEMMYFDAAARWRDAGSGRYYTSHDNEFWLAGVERVSPLLAADLGAGKYPFSRWPHECWSEGQRGDLEEMLAQRRFPGPTRPRGRREKA